MRFEEWDIDRLTPWANNPRDAEDKDLERIKDQIKDLGLHNGLLVHEDGTVLGGNMRLRVLKEMGYTKVPVRVVDAPTEERKLKYALSDNDRAGFYLRDKLTGQLAALPDFDVSMFNVDMGFSTSLAEINEVQVEPVAVDKDTVKEQFDTYLNAQIKQIVLYFKADEYDSIVARLEAVMSEEGLESHSEAFIRLLQAYEGAASQ